MKQDWEDAGEDFWSDHRLEIVVEGQDIVVYFTDETNGCCPHGEEPAVCVACRDYTESLEREKGRIPFWMKSIAAK